MASLYLSVISILLMSVHLSHETQLTYQFQEENPNTYVGTINRDAKLYENFTTEEYENLEYSIFGQANGEKPQFAVDKKSSSITATEILDREKICENREKCELKIDVGVYDTLSAVKDLKMVIQVFIILEDINDNKPKFKETEFNITIEESVKEGTEVLLEGASDPDVGLNTIKSYSLIPADGMFELNTMWRQEGQADLGLIVKHKLDRETKSSFDVEIIAKDGGNPPKTGTAKIKIFVKDDNDNPPQFITKKFEETVLETVPLNYPILRLVARDPDEGLNSELSYSFTSRTPPLIKEYIKIDESNGDVIPIKSFDFEVEKLFRFYVEVHDKGTPPQSDQAEVRINIEDVNDNGPTVNINLPPSGTLLAEDAELGSFIAHVSVSDNDDGANGVIACSIADTHFLLDKFSDSSYNYKILLQKPLDFETSATHLINVTCHDEGVPVKYGSSSFTLMVSDVNDNRPKFENREYIVTFMENNHVGDTVFKISAIDKDSGLNAKVSYEKLDDPEMLFSLESNSGFIRANKIFDHEVIKSAKFRVKAKDFGTPMLTSVVNVLVIIGDENDNAPKFSQPHYSYSVLENKPIGTSISMLNVTDLDSDANSKLIFTIAGNGRVQDYFTIDSDTGLIRTGKVFNREVEDKFEMSIQVQDAGNPNFKDNTQVTVYILDENDNNPIINYPNANNNTVYVPYTKPAGTVAAVIDAHDLDIDDNGELTYSIQKGNINEVFFLNPRSGEIVISRTLSLEDSMEYSLMIAVKDNGEETKVTYSELHVVITIGNGSLATYQRKDAEGVVEDSPAANTTIVLTIIIVTLVIALTVVIVIVVVCKIDRNRKMKAATNNTIVRYDSPASESTYSTSEGHDCDSEKQLKPERVYTLRENSVSSDGSTQSLAYPPMEQSLLKPSSRSGSSQSLKGRQTANTEPIDDPYRSPSNIHIWLQDQTLTKIPEDSTSQLSGGTEVSERDSGRGTSEEDSKIYHSDPEDPRPLHSPFNNGSKRVRFSDNNKNHPQIPITNQRTPMTYLHNGNNIQHPRDTVSRNIANSFRNSKNSMGERGYPPPPPPRGKHNQPSSPYSDIYNNSISESINEGDGSTTTSGSYTIANAYELCDDIDNLFFKNTPGTTVV